MSPTVHGPEDPAASRATLGHNAILDLKISARVPPKVSEFLEKFPSAFIMGGFITASIHDENFVDIDLFFHKNNAIEVFNFFGKDCFEEGDKIYFQSPSVYFRNITFHCRKIVLDGVSVDLVMYGDDFNPSINIDFSCRMLQYTHQGLRYPHYICLQDAMNKILRINMIWFYMNGLQTCNPYFCPPFWSHYSPAGVINDIRWHQRNSPVAYGPLPVWQQKLINNIEKYERRGYTLIS